MVAFPQIHSALSSDYSSGQIKLTYQGAQGKIRTSLAVVGGSRSGGFDPPAFLPFEHHGSYDNDAFFGDTLLLTTTEMRRFSTESHCTQRFRTPLRRTLRMFR